MAGQSRRRRFGRVSPALVVAAFLAVLVVGAVWVPASMGHGRSTPPAPVTSDAAPVAHAQEELLPPKGGLRRPVSPAAAPAAVGMSVRVANFNLYGCTESAPSWPSCTDRFPRQWSYINRHHLSIVGLQELEPSPYALFRHQVDAPGSGWAMYPSKPVFVHQQTTGVLWRSDQWRLVRAVEFKIPKYAWSDSAGVHTLDADEAAVLLQARSGARLWVLSVHNMSSENTGFAQGLARDEAIEAGQFAHRSNGGVAALLLGDFNDDTDGPICAILGPGPTPPANSRSTPTPTSTPSAPATATARPTSAQMAHSIWGPVTTGGCTNPAQGKGQPYDKIIGSAGVRFSNSGIDWSTQKSKLTDHGIAWVEAVLK